MDSKLKIRRKVSDENDMQSLEGRERERESEEEKEGDEQGGSRQWKYARKAM